MPYFACFQRLLSWGYLPSLRCYFTFVPVVFGTLLSLQCSMVIGAGIHFLVTSSPLGIPGARYFACFQRLLSWGYLPSLRCYFTFVLVVFGSLRSLQCSMVIGAGIHFLVTSSPLGIPGARYFVLGMWAFSWCVGGCRCQRHCFRVWWS